jgi:hypothetical protein
VPKYLTLGAVAAALWVGIGSGELLTGILPAAVVVACATADFALWERRRRPWHDWTVILLLLPAIASAVWISVGGLIVDVERSRPERLLLEVGPGVALTGLLCTLISYHGRHHPDETRPRTPPAAPPADPPRR